MKWIHSFGSGGCGEKRELEDWNCCGSINYFFGLLCVESGKPVGRISLWTHKLDSGVACYLEKIISSAYGWEVHLSYVASWLIINIFLFCFVLMLLCCANGLYE
jgi:hypothetical protein